MPRLVDRVGRFQFLREAAFLVVRDQGAAALSRRSVAAVLGTSAHTVRRAVAPEVPLADLAADEVADRRRVDRWAGLPKDPVEGAVALVLRLLPDHASRVEEELVWLHLMVHRTTVAPTFEVSPDRTAQALRRRFSVGQRGYAPDSQHAPPARDEPERLPCERHATEREEHVTASIDRALDLLGHGGERRPAEHRRLRALVDGVTLGVCLGRLAPADGVAAVRDHVASLCPGEPGHPGPPSTDPPAG